MLAKKSIRIKMLLYFGGLSLFFLLFLAFFSYQGYEKIVLNAINISLEHLVQERAKQMDLFLASAEHISGMLATAIEANSSLTEADLKELLRRTLVANPHIYGTAATFEPYAFYPEQKSFGPYWWRTEEGLQYISHVPDDYLYWNSDWYADSRDSGAQSWGQPYYDEGAGEALMVTSGAPFYDQDDKFLGVATVDISLEHLNHLLADLSSEQAFGAYTHAFLVNQEGIILGVDEQTLLANPAMELLMTDIWTTQNGIFKPLAEVVQGDQQGSRYITDPFSHDAEMLVIHTDIKYTGWKLILLADRDFVLRDMEDLQQTLFYLILIVIVATIGMVALITKSITRPIESVTQEMQELYGAELRAGNAPETADEIVQLTHTFESMNRRIESTIQGLEAEMRKRKQAEEEYARVAEQWSTTFDSTRDAIWILDSNQRILRVNKTSERLFPAARANFIGNYCWEITHGTSEPVSGCPFLKAKKSLNRESMELKLGEQWFLISVDPILNEDNELAGAVHIASDITERKKAEQKLRESEEQFRTAIKRAPIPMILTDAQQDIRLFNAKFSQQFGYTLADISTAEQWWRTVYPDEKYRQKVQDAWKVAITEAFENNTEIAMQEWDVISKDGSRRRVEFKMTPLGESSLIAMNDITERVEAQKALRESEKRLDLALSVANDGVWDWDLSSNEVYFDPRYYKMAGYEVDEFPHRFEEFEKRVHPEDLDEVLSQAEKHLVGQIPSFQVEFRFRRKDGTWMWIQGAGKIVEEDEAGNPLRFVGTHRDITERVAAKKELAQYREYLEEEVALRTAQLEEINQELTDFAYVVSHDLKAPLRGISQLSAWIVEDYSAALDAEGQELLHLLIDRAKHMHALIDGILEYSRVGRLSEEKRCVDLKLLVTELIEDLPVRTQIQITVTDDLPIVTGHRTRLRQVFQNLVENAIKYMDKEVGRIAIGCVEAGEQWHFSVADNGPGIAEKYFEKVFQIFETLAPRDQTGSTGVGLALVKKIVEDWGGKIWLESTVGEGSTFHFTLPKVGDCSDYDPAEKGKNPIS